MQSENPCVGDQKLRLTLIAVLFFSLPLILIFYFLFSLITIPATLLIWHFYKQQIKQHAKTQYDEANQLVLLIKDEYFVPLYDKVLSFVTSEESIPSKVLNFSTSQYKYGIELLSKGKEYVTSSIWGVFGYFVGAGEKVLEKILEVPAVKEVVDVVQPYWEIAHDKLSLVSELVGQVIEKLKYYVDLTFGQVQQLGANLGIVTLIETAKQRIIQIPNTQINIIGFAILNESGKTIENLPSAQELDRFRIQLHHHAITQFRKVKDFQNYEILELECGDAAGLQYIAQNYHPKRCLGIDSSLAQIQTNLKEYRETDNLKFEYKDVLQVGTASSPETFDVILGLELSKKPNFQNIDIKSYLKTVTSLLKTDGYLIVGDYDTQEKIQAFQATLQQLGLAMVEKSDITVGVTSAIKMQIKYVKKHVQDNGNFVAKFASRYLKPNEQLIQDFKSRKQIYMVYVLKKATL